MHHSRTQERAVKTFLEDQNQRYQEGHRGGALAHSRGNITPPDLRPARSPKEHAINAYIEFLAILSATREVNTNTCKKILQTFQRENIKLLEVELDEAKAAIYDNANSRVIHGKMSGQYMAAYNNTKGFVGLDESEGGDGPPKYMTPESDCVVVVAECTRVMLDERILGMASAISGGLEPGAALVDWDLPKLSWINGVPGCGKTTRIIKHFDEEQELIVTTTVEAAKDLKERLAHRLGAKAARKVRTMASILVNGIHEGLVINRLTVDEALMNHFGAIVMAARLTGAKDVTLIGDINQLPYIDRQRLFDLRYSRPSLILNITCELPCTYRSPMDVAYVLTGVYKTIYSASPIVHSLKTHGYTGARIPYCNDGTLYLVHTQEEKKQLKDQGYGSGAGSRIMTIHESQGQTFSDVVIVRTGGERLRIHESVSHAVVAVTRHTNTCVYYSDDNGDAIGTFISRAVGASSTEVVEANIKGAMSNRDDRIIQALLQRLKEGFSA